MRSYGSGAAGDTVIDRCLPLFADVRNCRRAHVSLSHKVRGAKHIARANYASIPQRFRWKSDVTAFAHLDGQREFGPTYEYEYNTREAYGASISSWGPNDPLNATWWHHVTEGVSARNRDVHHAHPAPPLCRLTTAMEANSTLVTVRDLTDYLPQSPPPSPQPLDDVEC